MENVIQQWDNTAATYVEDQERSEFAESNKAVIEVRFQRLNGERVLDLGCGYGWYTDFFARIGANAVGVDGSEKMIAIARERYPNLEFTIADIEKPLPYTNE
ncbi:MAG: class I SAM-dependent methyltransferase, partial [Oscillospiraceae bacterium]|nr:class I SAM-dependent methyltransferase [Oscillospiraceae bacterium]